MADNLDMQKIISWCQKYEVLLSVVYEDDELRSFFRGYNVFYPTQEMMDRHRAVRKALDECMHEAYAAGVVITDYKKVIEETSIDVGNIRSFKEINEEWIGTLSDKQILACVAWIFRRDHFLEGSYLTVAVGEGVLLPFVRELLSRYAAGGQE